MDCPKCKAVNSENAAICIVCGEPLQQPEPEQKTEDMTGSATVAPQMPYGFVPGPYVAPPVYMRPARIGDQSRNWQAICGMICGIASIPMLITAFGGMFTAVAAIIFSIKGLKSQKSGMAIAGIICACIGLLFSIGVAFFLIRNQIVFREFYQ